MAVQFNSPGAVRIDGELVLVGGALASGVPFTPAGSVAATDVQAAIAELDTEKQTQAQADIRYGRVIAGSGVHVPHTGDLVEFTLATVTLPAGTLGPNGWVEIEALWSHTNNANNKTLRIKFGGTNYFSLAVTTGDMDRAVAKVQNRNNVGSQVGGPANRRGFENGSTVITSGVNTSADVTILITGQLANAADAVNLESYSVKAFYKA